MAFDPDAFLAEAPSKGGFDPDAFLAGDSKSERERLIEEAASRALTRSKGAGQFPQSNQMLAAFAKGANSTATAGITDAIGNRGVIDERHDPESPEFTNPYSRAAGEVAGLGIGAGTKLLTTGANATKLAVEEAAKKLGMKGILRDSAGAGFAYGATQGASDKIQDQDATTEDVLAAGGKGGLIGGTAGALLPLGIAGAFKGATAIEKQLNPTLENLLEKYGDKYRQILAPSKGEIKNVEIKSGKDLDDIYQLAAKEKLIIGKSPDNKLDTTGAIEQLQAPKQELADQISSAIASKPQKTFSLTELADQAKARLRDAFKNDADYEDAVKTVDEELAAAVKNRGESVNGSELNQIKQGMWSKSYNAMAPNSNKVARIIGNVAKDAIEDAYPETDIKGLNSELGNYFTLENLLNNAEGRVIARGKLGKYAAQGIGALAGHATGLPIGGEIAGAYLGGALSDHLVNPERITTGMAKRIDRLLPVEEAPSLGGKISIEEQAQNLAQRAQMQRAADKIKSEELGKQAETAREPAQVALEEQAQELAAKAKMARTAEIIKDQELQKQGYADSEPASPADVEKFLNDQRNAEAALRQQARSNEEADKLKGAIQNLYPWVHETETENMLGEIIKTLPPEIQQNPQLARMMALDKLKSGGLLGIRKPRK